LADPRAKRAVCAPEKKATKERENKIRIILQMSRSFKVDNVKIN
jgi:hypothetical protein